ncbi:MAG: hypothetical protein PVH88_15275 [Ignavibacteria bacterium]
MFIIKSLKYLLIVLLLLSTTLKTQTQFPTVTRTDTLLPNLQNYYPFKSVSVLPLSEEIILSGKKLKAGDYNIDYREAYFELSENLEYSLFDTIYFTYEMILTGLKKEYKKRSLVRRFDRMTNDSIMVVKKESSAFTPESIFGSDIKRSGTILRGFTVGTNKDFTVESGLRLELSGKLSEDIEIVAALTDENTPIEPEGNTETLEELDKVFIEVKHKNAIGTFGDYTINETIGEFGVVDRKLQGLKGEFLFENNNGAIAIASSRGKFNTNSFSGEDGSQGPYRLTGRNSENSIVVIAGSEKVFLDGEELTRGENNDYTIEYANAEITFTPNRLITSASRIIVDFEYTERQYQRNFFSTNYRTSLFNNSLKVNFGYIREGDDEGSPIDISLSDDERAILENAGDYRYNAIVDGVSLAEPDSTGEVTGIYTKVDTLIDGETFAYYVYDPGAENSLYNVVFSYVGLGEGDYAQISSGNYLFVGIGQGSYLPVKFLPLPELRQMTNLLIETTPFKDVNLNIELAGSSWDKNNFSDLNDDDNLGYARNITLDIKPREIKLGNINLGKVGVSYKDRFIQTEFTTLDRIDEAEFGRYYNIDESIDEDEELREIGLTLIPFKELNINSQYGFLSEGSSFRSDRFVTGVKLEKDKIVNLNYNLDYVVTDNESLNTDWIRQDGSVEFFVGSFTPGFEFLHEDKQSSYDNSDSLSEESLKYVETAPFIGFSSASGISVSAKYSFREEFSPINGNLEKESEAVTRSLNFSYSGLREVKTEWSLAFRTKEFTDKFKEHGSLNNETVLIRSQSRFDFWQRAIDGSLFYEASTEKTAKLERVFVKVEQGTGNYIYLGDLNNNGVAEEEEFESTQFEGDYITTTIPTDELYPVIDLMLNTRWRVEPAKLISGKGFFPSLLKPLSTETVWRVEENSTEEDTKKIYLLNFSSFLNDSNTVSGTNYIQNDFHIFKNKRELSFRHRFTQRRTLNQYAGGIEKAYYREQGIRVKFRMVKEISNQSDVIFKTDNVISEVNSTRSRELTGTEFVSDFSYRPIKNLEVGFKFSVENSTDNYPDTPTEIESNSQSISGIVSFSNKGRLKLEFERIEITVNNDNSISSDILQGNSIGKNYFARVNFDYRISGNLQTSFSYSGRQLGKGKIIHTMTAEARAFF